MKTASILFTVLLIASCQNQTTESVTNIKDYDVYLSSTPNRTTSKYFELWNSKIKPDSIQLISFGIVAGEYSRFFKNTGEVKYLKLAEKALKKAVDIAAIGKAGYQRALARNYISQHRFKEALKLAVAAQKMGSGLRESQYLLFDVHMELGNYEQAQTYLDSIKNFSDFGSLIRLAKWNDYKGDLSTTIRLMEQAKLKAETSKNRDLQLWAYTNLADYHGHAGKIKESYEYYLMALRLDPNNAYAKKGIAWLVFSFEKKPQEALRILDAITQTHKAPEYYLLKSQIAAFMGDDHQYLNNLDNYYKIVLNNQYGPMYNIPNAELYLDHTAQYNRGLQLALEEVANRPTPETYGLLAYAYYKDGQISKALEIAEQEILGKTYEPGVLLYVAEIFKAHGKTERVAELRSELKDAAYELGPAAEEKIRAL